MEGACRTVRYPRDTMLTLWLNTLEWEQPRLENQVKESLRNCGILANKEVRVTAAMLRERLAGESKF